MDDITMEAVYEHGTLKLPQELPLSDGQRVRITIHHELTFANHATFGASCQRLLVRV